MSGADEEWVKAAMTDDTMVVELLVRLHGGASPLKPPTLEWTVRQRRSRPVSVSSSSTKHLQRASPTTPLSATSFSGGSGGSAAAAGYELSSRKLSTTTTRSKVNGDSEKTASKRSRKKKTLAELKDDESTLLKERRDLKREIAALHVHLEKERSTNENLKRMKIEMQPLPDREIASTAEESISGQLLQKITSNHPLPPVMSQVVSDYNVSLQSSTSDGCPKFVLPDLNVPFEEGGSLS